MIEMPATRPMRMLHEMVGTPMAPKSSEDTLQAFARLLSALYWTNFFVSPSS